VLLYTPLEVLVFRFQNRVMQNVEGDVQRLDDNCCRVLMCEAHDEDTMSDIRDRMIRAIERAFSGRHELVKEVTGNSQFFIKSGETWNVVKEFTRVQAIVSGNLANEIIFKLQYGKHQNSDDLKEEERDLAGFDCYSLYQHADQTSEWRLCKIMQREPIINQADNPLEILQKGFLDVPRPQSDHPSMNFYYWIEFLHHRKNGQKLWLRRRREEILMSARYSREQVRNYEQET
jgi:hypothetical protein